MLRNFLIDRIVLMAYFSRLVETMQEKGSQAERMHSRYFPEYVSLVSKRWDSRNFSFIFFAPIKYIDLLLSTNVILIFLFFSSTSIGIPEIGTQPMEPLHIEKVSIAKGQGGVTLQGSFKDLIVHGPSNTTALYTRLNAYLLT